MAIQVLLTRREAQASSADPASTVFQQADGKHDTANGIALQESKKLSFKLGPNDVRFF